MNNTTKKEKNRWPIKILLIALSLLLIAVPTTLAQEANKDFVVVDGQEGKEYDAIFANRLVEVDGKLAYSVEDEDNRFIVFDGQELGKEHDLAQLPAEVNDKLAYNAYDNGESFIQWGDRKIGQEYDSVSNPTEVGGGLAYEAWDEETEKNFLVWKGEELESRHDRGITYIIDVGGQPAYGVSGRNTSFVVHDGEEGRRVDVVWEMVDVSGDLAYSASGVNGTRFVVYDNQKVSGEYDKAYSPVEVDGKLAYEATKDGEDFIVFDGREIGKNYYRAFSPAEIDEKLAYIADEGGRYRVVFDGSESDKSYEGISHLVDIGGKPAYVARDEEDREFVVWDGRIVSEKYGPNEELFASVSNLIEVDEKPAYLITERPFSALIGREIGRFRFVGSENPGFTEPGTELFTAKYNRSGSISEVRVMSFNNTEAAKEEIQLALETIKNGGTYRGRNVEEKSSLRTSISGETVIPILFEDAAAYHALWRSGKDVILVPRPEGVTTLVGEYLKKHPSDIKESEKDQDMDRNDSSRKDPKYIIEKDIGEYSFEKSSVYDTPREVKGSYMGVYKKFSENRTEDTAKVRIVRFEDRKEAQERIQDLGPGYDGTRTIQGKEVMKYKHHYRWLHKDKIIIVGDPLKETNAPLRVVKAYLDKYPSSLRDSSKESDLISVNLEKGWNLVSNGILAGYTITQGSGIKRTDIGAIFHYNSQKNRYMKILPDPKIDEQEIEELSEEGYATWVYSRESGKLTFEKGKPIKPIQNRILYDGWNLVSIEKSIVGKTDTGDNIQIKDIMGSCKIEDTYLYDPDTGWNSLSLQAPLGKSLQGKGMLVEVQNNCSLEKPQKEIQPPELPGTEPTPPPKNP